MFLFVFTASPAIKFKVDLPEVHVLAETEEEARALAHAAIPVATNSCPDKERVETHIVGVSSVNRGTFNTWKSPFKHPYLTLCEKRDLPKSVITYGLRYDPSNEWES